MALTDDEKAGLGVAFNEATWLGAEVDVNRRMATVTLSVLTLPTDGPAPGDHRIRILLKPVGRVWALLSSPEGDVLQMDLASLLAAVQGFGGRPIYGWEFFDLPLPPIEPSHLSCRVELGESGLRHVLYLFQDGGMRGGSLRLWLWFDELAIRAPSGDPISVAEFIAGGRRWWEALQAGDPRTSQVGIFPLKGSAG